mgnify:CR=1 FL=1
MNFTEFSEGYKPFPSDKVTRKVKALDAEKAMGLSGDTDEQKAKNAKRRMRMDMAVYVDKDPELRGMHRSAKQTIEKNNREKGRQKMEEELDSLFTDPLEDLNALWENEMNVLPKPDIQSEVPNEFESEHRGMFQHPVTKQRNEIDSLIAQGQDPVSAHQSVHGDIDPGNIESKAGFAATLGRLSDDGNANAVPLDKMKRSILSRDAEIEASQDQVTKDDLRTPMNQQVPDYQQTPQDQVAEELDNQDEYDYNEDVAYLQQFGRA